MNADIKELFDRLDGATYTATYANNKADATAQSLVLTDKNGTKQTITANTTFKIGNTDFSVKVGTDGTMEIGLGATAGTIDTTLVKLTAASNTDTNGSSGTITYTLAADTSKFTAASKPSASVAQPESTVSKANSNNAATAPLTYTDHLVLQAGARTKDSVDFTFSYKTEGMGDLKANLDVSSRENGLNTANLSLNTQESANAAIDKIDNAINKVSMVRATFGATQNRLEHKVENLTTTAENLTEAESGIRDTDMAQEMLNYTKFNVLQQAAQSMLAQANQQPQSILQLLG